MARNTAAIKRGWSYDQSNTRLDVFVDGTKAAIFNDSGSYLTIPAGGLTVTAGGITITAGGLTVTAGGATITAGGLTVTAGDVLITGGRLQQNLEVTDDDTQDMTLAAADIVKGINVHTTTTGAGTVTTDTAANIVSTCGLSNVSDSVISYYINDGNQTATFSNGTGVTVADTGQTVATDESAILVWRATNVTSSSEAVTLYIIGA